MLNFIKRILIVIGILIAFIGSFILTASVAMLALMTVFGSSMLVPIGGAVIAISVILVIAIDFGDRFGDFIEWIW